MLTTALIPVDMFYLQDNFGIKQLNQSVIDSLQQAGIQHVYIFCKQTGVSASELITAEDVKKTYPSLFDQLKERKISVKGLTCTDECGMYETYVDHLNRKDIVLIQNTHVLIFQPLFKEFIEETIKEEFENEIKENIRAVLKNSGIDVEEDKTNELEEKEIEKVKKEGVEFSLEQARKEARENQNNFFSVQQKECQAIFAHIPILLSKNYNNHHYAIQILQERYLLAKNEYDEFVKNKNTFNELTHNFNEVYNEIIAGEASEKNIEKFNDLVNCLVMTNQALKTNNKKEAKALKQLSEKLDGSPSIKMRALAVRLRILGNLIYYSSFTLASSYVEAKYFQPAQELLEKKGLAKLAEVAERTLQETTPTLKQQQ